MEVAGALLLASLDKLKELMTSVGVSLELTGCKLPKYASQRVRMHLYVKLHIKTSLGIKVEANTCQFG